MKTALYTRSVAALGFMLLLGGAGSALAQHTITPLIVSGEHADKEDMVIVGDGFAAGADQVAFNNWVDAQILNGLFAPGRFFGEQANAFNVWRINTVSQDSGVTEISGGICPLCGHTQDWGSTDKSYPCHDDKCKWCGAPLGLNIEPEDDKDTALDLRRSGDWCRCWSETGPDFEARYQAIVGGLAPWADVVVMVLNHPDKAGCGGEGWCRVSLGNNWTTVQHELGHSIGGLADEYWNDSDATNSVYAGDEPAKPNVTTDLADLKWADFVDPDLALPTSLEPWMQEHTVGAFEGAHYHDSGVYRPADNCVMRNGDHFCSVCSHQLREAMDEANAFTYSRSYTGDFDGDGHQDLLVHFYNTIHVYRGVGTSHACYELMFSATGTLGGWGSIRDNDRFYVADYDGDGDDDLYVLNVSDWQNHYFGMLNSMGALGFTLDVAYQDALPGWGGIRENDTLHVADFNGDGREDLYIFNGYDWDRAYLGMVASLGDDVHTVELYREELPGWDDMLPFDRFHVADFDGDGRDDVYVVNARDWSVGYLGMLRSTGNSLEMARRYDDFIPGWDSVLSGDDFYVADFDRDGRDDLYAFNGTDWPELYLGMLRSTGAGLGLTELYRDYVPFWGLLAPNDRFYPADVDDNAVGRDDLYIYNGRDWSQGGFLGVMRSSGAGLSGDLKEHHIGRWELAPFDRIQVTDFEGNGKEDLVIYQPGSLGCFTSNGDTLGWTHTYPRWIHNATYHVNGWW